MNPEILISKIELCGNGTLIVICVRSYLENRQQFMKTERFKSECLDIFCGITQGSVMEPKFFIMFINDICKEFVCLKCVPSADDTNVLSTGKNLQQLLNLVNSELSQIKKWYDKYM